jgi:hypothetical protein
MVGGFKQKKASLNVPKTRDMTAKKTAIMHLSNYLFFGYYGYKILAASVARNSDH